MRRTEAIVRLLSLAVPIALLAIGCSKDSTSPTSTPPSLVRIEAEGFANASDGGGSGITTPYCSGASGQHAVEGIDFDGDWIEIPFSLSETGCFSDSLRGEGIENDIRRFAVAFYQNGVVVASDTLETPPGKGFG